MSNRASYGVSTVTITAGDATGLSTVFNSGGQKIVAIDLPSIVSAAISFQGSADGVTYRDVYNADGTTQTSISATTGDRMVACPAAVQAFPFIKIRSGLTGSAVTQTTTNRTIGILTEKTT